jgi:hypothetical protein
MSFVIASSWVPYVVFPGVTLAAIVLLFLIYVDYRSEHSLAPGVRPGRGITFTFEPAFGNWLFEIVLFGLAIAGVVAMSIATYHRMR